MRWIEAGGPQDRHCQLLDVGDDGLATLGLLPDEGPDEAVEEEGDGGYDEAVADVANVPQQRRHNDWWGLRQTTLINIMFR